MPLESQKPFQTQTESETKAANALKVWWGNPRCYGCSVVSRCNFEDLLFKALLVGPDEKLEDFRPGMDGSPPANCSGVRPIMEDLDIDLGEAMGVDRPHAVGKIYRHRELTPPPIGDFGEELESRVHRMIQASDVNFRDD